MLDHSRQLPLAFLYENLVIEAARGKDQPPLVAIYPADGTLAADNPFGIVAGPHQSEATIKAARLFRQHLLGNEQQLLAMDRGFRPAAGNVKLSPLVFKAGHGVRIDTPQLLPLPSAHDLQRVTDYWRQHVKRKAQVTLVLDVSRSMDGEKIAALKRGAKALLRDLADDERIAVFTFARRIEQLQKLAAVGDCRADLGLAIDRIQTAGGTYLVEATLQAVKYAAEAADPLRTSIVVVMTDGRDPRYQLHEEAFLDKERAIRSHGGVLVFTIGIGGEQQVDRQMLERLASAPTAATLVDDHGIERVFEEQIRAQF
jgi:Ca-activated chloride channel family protein